MIGYDMFPRWARFVLVYDHRFPNHRGKRTLIRSLYRLARRSGRPFVWRMKNGALVALLPAELLHDWTVSSICFHRGTWQPHVENALLELLKPGDTAYDIGANVGYFSAVMAKAVGRSGRVFAFEPVPEPYERLVLCQRLNDLSQLTALPIAIGARGEPVALTLDPSSPGQASFHESGANAATQRIDVPMRRLDDLLSDGQLAPPTLIKMDVEGHELAVVEGAEELLAKYQPVLIFELNIMLSRQAEWTPSTFAKRLRKAADYRFFVLEAHGPRAVDLDGLVLQDGDYPDVLAIPNRGEPRPRTS
jgi:FkbM family methyltransferase